MKVIFEPFRREGEHPLDKHGKLIQTFIPKEEIPDFPFKDCDGIVVSSAYIPRFGINETCVFKGKTFKLKKGLIRKTIIHAWDISDYKSLMDFYGYDKHDTIINAIKKGEIKLE